MKQLFILLVVALISTTAFASINYTEDFVMGDPEIQSVHAMAFGPESILFIGDSDAAQVVAIDLSNQQKAQNEKMAIADLEDELSKLLGTETDQLQIIDLSLIHI